MAKLVPIVLKLDSSQAKTGIRQINRELSKLGVGKVPIGFSPRQLKRFETQIKNQRTMVEASAKAQANVAIEQAKRITNVQKAQLRQIENVEKTKQKLSLQTARAADKAASDARAKAVKQKQIEARAFDQAENRKNKIQLQQSRERIAAANREARAVENAKKREWQEFQRRERQKTVAQNQAARNRAALGGNIQSAGQSVTRIGVATTAAVTVPIVAATASILKMGAQYEVTMNTFQATTSATADQMARASKEAIKLGNDLTLPGVSAADAGDAMTALAKNAFSADQAIEAANGTLRLSRAVNLEGALAAEILAAAINTFGLEAKEATRIADLYAASANASSSTTVDMFEAMKNAGSVAKSMKIPIEDMVTAISLLANAGIKGGDAGTGLKATLLSLAAPSSKAKDAMETLGFKAFDAEGNLKSLRTIINELNERTKDLTPEQALPLLKAIFGKIGIKTALPLLDAGIDKFDKMSKAVQKSGAATELSAAKNRGLAGAWDGLISKIETFGLSIFEKIKGPLTAFVFFLADAVGKAQELFDSLPASIQGIIFALIALAAAIGPVLVVIGTLITLVGAVMATITAAGGITAILTGIGIAILALTGLIIQLTPVVIGVAASITAAVAAWKNDFGGFRTFVTEAFIQVQAIVELVMGKILELTTLIGGKVVEWWEANYPLIEEVVSRVSFAIRSIVETFLGVIVGFWEAHGETIINFVSGMWTRVKGIISTFTDLIGGIVRLFLQLMARDWDGAWETLLKLVTTWTSLIVQSLKHWFTTIWGIFLAIVAAVAKFGVMFVTTLFRWVTRAVVGAGDILAKLPFIIIALIPRIISAGMAIGQAIWRGIKEGLAGAAASSPLDGDVIGIGAGASGSIGASLPGSGPTLKLPKLGGIGGGSGRRGGGGGRSGGRGRTRQRQLTAIEQLRKSAADANKEVGFLNSSLEVLDLKTQIIKSNRLKSLAEQLIKLREEVGDRGRPLPRTQEGLEKEIKLIEESTAIAKEANKLTDEMREKVVGTTKAKTFLQKASALVNRAIKNGTDEFTKQSAAIFFNNARLADNAVEKEKLAKVNESIVNKGNQTIANLTKEIELFGETDKVEQLLIKNKFELLDLREQLIKDGFGEASILEAEKHLKATQASITALTKKLELLKKERDLQKEIQAAEEFGQGLQEELESLRRFGKELSVYEETLKNIEENFKNISPAQKEYILTIAKQIDQQKAFNEEYAQTQDFIRNTLDILVDTSLSFKDRLKEIFGNILNSFKKMIVDMTTAWVTSKLFGLSTGGSGNQGGGFGGGILGSIFNRIFNPSGGSSGPGGTPNFNPAGGSGQSAAQNIASQVSSVTQSLSREIRRTSVDTPLAITDDFVLSGATEPTLNVGGDIAGAATGSLKNFSLANLGKSLGALAPALGLSLGGALGGQSGLGQILGSAGGLLGGLVIGASTGAIGGGLGSALALSGTLGPIAAIAAPLLLLGSFFLGRNKRRRQEEKIRNQLSLDAWAQIDSLIKDVNLDRIDGQTALAQANGVRSNYLAEANKLTDKKTRTHAIQSVRDVDSRIAQLRTAVSAQEQRQAVGSELTPAFRLGGVFDSATGSVTRLPKNFNGRIPGAFNGADDVLMAVSKGERVLTLTPDQENQIPSIQTPGIGTENFEGTIIIDNLNITIEGDMDPELITFKGIQSERNQKVIVNKVRTKQKDG